MENKQLQLAKDTIAQERNFKDWNDLNKGKIRVYNEEYIDQVAIEYHRLMSEWVSVDKRLPETGEKVMAFSPQLGILCAMARLNIDIKWKYTNVSMFIHESNKITHWKELPQPPK